MQSSNILKADWSLSFKCLLGLPGYEERAEGQQQYIFMRESECDWLLAHHREKNKGENESDSEVHPIS